MRSLRASPSKGLRGAAQVPGDKSISHRALILAALTEGRTTISGLLEGADVLATAEAVRAFGAEVRQGSDGVWTVEGRGEFRQPDGVIDCGNSGTGLRLLMGAAAGYLIQTTFDGDESLRARPVDRVAAPLTDMGARVQGERLPITVTGSFLRGLAYEPPVASAQVKSAVLLAALNAAGPVTVLERLPTRDHTERMLAAFGADISVEETEIGRAVHLRPGARLRPTHVKVPGDFSSAAFPLGAALIVPGSEVTLEGVLVNPLRTGLLDTLREMGAEVEVLDVRSQSGEPVGDIVARSSTLRGVIVPPERAPAMIDEYPLLAVVAAFAQGATVMRGVGDLRNKETDRITATAAALRACGVQVDEEMEGLVVHGRGRPPRGGAVETHGDHRLAMAFAVLGLGAEAPVTVDRPEMIGTSFPGFLELMRALGGRMDLVP